MSGVTTIQNVRLAGIASAVPPLRELSWEEFGVPATRFVRARLQGRRPVVREARWEQCQSDFCVAAAKQLTERLGWEMKEIDLVVLVTLTPDYPIPATAIILQDRLGIPKTAAAFDVPGGDMSFLHGLQLAASMVSMGHLKRALLLCGEVSKVVEPREEAESLSQICGHNGSVVALEHAPGAPPMFFGRGGDGSAHGVFEMSVGGTRRPPRPEMFTSETGAADNPATHYTIDAAAVAATALRELPGCMRAVLGAANLDSTRVDHTFLQPINLAADDALRRELGVPRDRFHSVCAELGHGGSGGIVLAMLARAATALASGRQSSLFAAIGAGLAWGSALVTTEKLVCPEPLELA